MSIPTILTRGFGNGNFTGTIDDVVLVGYSIGDEPDIWTEQPNVSTLWEQQLDESDNWSRQENQNTIWTKK